MRSVGCIHVNFLFMRLHYIFESVTIEVDGVKGTLDLAVSFLTTAYEFIII